MKRVMLVSALALGLAGGLCAAPTLQTLTVNDDGKGDRQVLGIFGNYQNISVKEAESGATTITFSVRTENLELSESTTITVAPKTDGGYTVTLGEGAPQEATEVWLFAGTYRGQNQSDSAWRSLYISGGHLERVFGGGYEETQKEVPTSALGLPVNLTVAGGTFGSVAGGSYNGGPIMETMVTGGDIDVLAANGMADADLTEDFVEESDAEALKETTDSLTEIFRKALGNDKLEVKVEKMKNENISSMITLSEESRRMQDMMKMYSMGGSFDPGMFGGQTLVLNANNKLVQYILEHKDAENVNLFCEQLYDLALISNQPLAPEAMTKFIARSNEIMMLLAK